MQPLRGQYNHIPIYFLPIGEQFVSGLCEFAGMNSAAKYLLFIWILPLAACQSITGVTSGNSTPPRHQKWDALLQKYVSKEGKVNYVAFLADSTSLNAYLAELEANHPGKDWSENEQLAYWINAYNAYTVQLILRHYPVESIKE